MSLRGGVADVAISWYHPSTYSAETSIVPGDSHGPDGPRNDIVIGGWVHHRYCAKQQFTTFPANKEKEEGAPFLCVFSWLSQPWRPGPDGHCSCRKTGKLWGA